MFKRENRENTTETPLLGGGPLGYGDPNDFKLRKTEKDIILPKLIRKGAEKRCMQTLTVYLNCVKDAGLLFPFKCNDENKANDECILSWSKNPEFIKEVTENYLKNRSHFRRTGEALERYERKPSKLSSGSEDSSHAKA